MPFRYRIQKEVKFEAAHQLFGLEEGHPCGNLHGHSYLASIILESSTLDVTGFVFDFGVIGGAIKSMYDHKFLNEVIGKKNNPTAEIVAKQIFELISGILFKMDYHDEVKVMSVRLWETESSWAEVKNVPSPS